MKLVPFIRSKHFAVTALALASSAAFAQQTNPGFEPIRGLGLAGFTDKPLPLDLVGVSPTIGRFTCHGEIRVSLSRVGGVATGVAIFRNDKGDRLVGNVSWTTDLKGKGEITFDWKDSVTFSDGTVSTSTGIFSKTKPKQGKGKTQQTEFLKIVLIDIYVN